MSKQTHIERFKAMADVGDDDECWPWKGGRDDEEYGVYSGPDGVERATRYAYKLFKGELDPGDVIMHTCNRPSCVNPKHLVAASQAENMKHKADSGRAAKGASNGNSREARRRRGQD